MPFDEYVRFLADNYSKDKRIDSPLGSKCKGCEFDADAEELKAGMKSGFRECWKKQAKFKDADFDTPLTLDLWNSKAKNDLIANGKYFLHSLLESDVLPKKETEQKKTGLSKHARRMVQIDKAKRKDTTPFLDTKGLKAEMAGWKYPLHFIDFETSTSALPFTRAELRTKGSHSSFLITRYQRPVRSPMPASSSPLSRVCFPTTPFCANSEINFLMTTVPSSGTTTMRTLFSTASTGSWRVKRLVR